ncbi:DUF4785 domain-containing protein [Thalassomonas actiniarum]|uniref:DUF4785 family protein n=1 Tax=Thalassomonas actiniarum TaxID=485447 RepID=A0AAE9YNR3_9GAMM|nr:DUF4785 domain-containing protein [Thalassomonas actiniarum]WDD98041.1 DUF4785 family protein [Thalassomonas actiniarum]
MKLSKLTIGLLTATSIMLCGQLSASSLVKIGDSVKTTEQDLVTIALPEHKVEQQAVHYSQRISADSQLKLAPQAYNSSSDEYWFEVSGKELNRGIAVNVSQPGALIRLSGKRSTAIDSAMQSIDPAHLELSKDNNKLSSPFSQSVSQEQLATANIFPNSSAVKLNKTLGTGKFNLRVTQALDNNQRYIINVKEKNSAHKLQVALPKQSYLSGETLHFNAGIYRGEQVLADSSHQAFIKLPSGEKQPVNLTVKDGQYRVEVPQGLEAAPLGKLYELHLSSQATDNGTRIKRNGKVAFAVARQTAQLTGEAEVLNDQALVALEVASEGRYEVSALVSGTDSRGQLTRVMLSRSAYYLEPGSHKVALNFDTAILADAGVKAPYKVENLRLMDQSRMALLAQQ